MYPLSSQVLFSGFARSRFCTFPRRNWGQKPEETLQVGSEPPPPPVDRDIAAIAPTTAARLQIVAVSKLYSHQAAYFLALSFTVGVVG